MLVICCYDVIQTLPITSAIIRVNVYFAVSVVIRQNDNFDEMLCAASEIITRTVDRSINIARGDRLIPYCYSCIVMFLTLIKACDALSENEPSQNT